MRKTLSRMDKPLLIITIAFFIFGLIMILSASSMESYMRYGSSPYYYFIRQAIFLACGTVLAFIIIKIPISKYRILSKLAILGSIIALAGLTIYGYAANNAQSWFQIGPLSIQPSEFAKIEIILYLALYYDENKNKLDNQWTLIKPLLLCVIIFFLIAMQPDLGTAMVIALLTIIIFYSVPMKKSYRKLFNRIFLGAIAIVVAILITTGGSILRNYQLERFNFIDPCDRYQEESGYQLCNSFIAFHNGGLTGQGIGQSTQKYLYLPESYTDFIFPIIVEEWGLLVGAIIIIVYGVILYRLLRLAKRATNLRNAMITYGVFAYILLHIAINLIGVMGLGPLTGIPLPFLSYGGSYTLSMIIALSLVQRVAIETNIDTVKKEKKRRR